MKEVCVREHQVVMMEDSDLEEAREKLWVIVRYNNGAEFKVRGGEIFKIGRVKFRVREVILDS